MNLQPTLCDSVHVGSEKPPSPEAEAILSELLVLRCRRGEPEAWRELVRHWEKRLLYYLRRLLPDERDAWDELQQTWIEVFRNLRTLRNPKALRPWLYRIAHYRAISHRRRVSREPAMQSADEPGDRPELNAIAVPEESDNWTGEAAGQIHEAIGRLSLAHREVITLFFLEQMPVEEIADVLGVPPGTVKSRLFYAKRALRDAIERSETI